MVIEIQNHNLMQQDRIIDTLCKLSSGTYVFSVRRIDQNRTLEDWRKEYFAKVTELGLYTGYSKTELHTLYKHYRKGKQLTESSRELLSTEDWVEYIKTFEDFAFIYDVLL